MKKVQFRALKISKYIIIMFLTKLYKNYSFPERQNQPKATKTELVVSSI